MNRYVFHVDPRHKGEQDEAAIQVQFRKLLAELAPKVFLFGIPNAGRRTAWEKRQRAAEGMVKGFPDNGVVFDGRVAFLEFKTGSGSLGRDQVETLNRLVQRDIPVGVFRSADTAIEWLRSHWPSAFRGGIAA